MTGKIAERWLWRTISALKLAVFLLLVFGVRTAYAQGGAPAVTMVISAGSSPNYSAPATVNVSVTAIDFNDDVTQTNLYKDNVLIASAADSYLQATLTNLPAGTYTIKATATNNLGKTGVKTQTITIAAGNAPPAVGLTSPANGQTFTTGNVVTLSATASDSDGTVSQIGFYVDGNLVGTSTTAPYSIAWTSTIGTHNIYARATDNSSASTNSGAVSITVNPPPNVPPTVSLTNPTNGQTFTTGNVVTLSANASDSDGTVSQVGFYVDGNLVGTSTTAPYSIAWTSTVGTHNIYARATDNSSASTNSGTVSITVNDPPPPSTIRGHIDGVDGSSAIVGWACSSYRNDSIVVHLYVGGAYGTGTYIGAYNANLASEPAVASACSASGTNYRFSIPLSDPIREQYAGQKIYIHGISPVGGSNDLIAQSGIFAIPPPQRVATFISQSVPTTMVTGQSATVTVQMRNDGAATWTAADSYKLGSQNPQDNTTWTLSNRIGLTGSVAPGQSATFTFGITAPTTPGTYNFQWRMVQDGVAWFGGATTNVAVQVTAPPPPVSESPTPTPLPPTAGSFGKIDIITYFDNTTNWVLGQVASVTDQATGLVQSATTYDPVTALPTETYVFGKLQSKFTYNADGTPASVKDGRNNTTTFSSWMRGIPQSIQYADATTQSAVVNDAGWIMSVTDENGYVTGYSYDAMGRVSGITYPTGDAPAWTNTTIAFAPSSTAAYGLPAGHWEQVTQTGNRKKVVAFDALWRPVVTFQQDAGSPQSTTSVIAQNYDSDNRLVYQSYPFNPNVSGWGTQPGVTTVYDALGRVTAVAQDTELSPSIQVATTEYLSGFQTRVTNPRGFATVTSYMTYDQPRTDWPLVINAPDSATTTIARDPFGKPTAITRSGGGISVTRSYSYNAYQELCRSVEPEVGATLFAYDAAGNLASSAAGLDAATACGTANSRTVSRAYDARNRLQTLTFPDGVGDQSWQYTPDGLPSQITTYNSTGNGTPVVNAYSYNRRRLLAGETSAQTGWYSWSLGYGYDANANLASNAYPDGSTITYTNNALGQPTQVGSNWGTLASGVSYYPNGAIKQFTYGNGIVHTMSQNARQLPARSTDSAGVLNDVYYYDVNGNVDSIIDELVGAGNYSLKSRWMRYDGLDRLIGAGAGMFGGTDNWYRFSYNAQDNIISWKLAGVKDYANYIYDASNRLTNIQNSAGASVVALAYDVQGNLHNKNGQGYQFDFGNRLRAATNQEEYRYDGLGRRVMSWSPTQGNILSMYSSSGQLLFQQDQRKTLNIPQVYLGGSVLARLEYNTTTNTGQLKYEHTDALGSPVAITNQAGQVVERTDYEPYGNVIGKPNNDRVGYTGHVMDSATGLTYMQQRYYDPTIGRFLSVDPVTAYEKPGQNFNRYVYALNNPYRFTDPDGRQSVGEMIDSGAQGCGKVTCAGWAILNAGWKVFGAEGVSKISDKGWSATSGADKAGAGMEVLSAIPGGKLIGGVAHFARELKVADLGLKGLVKELKGSFAVKDGVATMRIDMIRGEIKNPLQVVSNMIDSARATGATSLRIEGTIANERLYNILEKRYGLTSNGGTDVITVPLK